MMKWVRNVVNNQVDYNIVNEATIPMELTWEMVSTKENKAVFDI